MNDDPRISLVELEPGRGIVHRQVIPFFKGEFLLCPRCGVEADSWAADEDPVANQDGTVRSSNVRFDWWDCPCGATGAYMHPHLPGVTQNGIPLIGYSQLVPDSGIRKGES